MIPKNTSGVSVLQRFGNGVFQTAVGQELVFQIFGKRERGVQARDSANGRVQIMPALFLNASADFSTDPTCHGVFVEDERTIRFPNACHDVFFVPWKQGAEVDDFNGSIGL